MNGLDAALLSLTTYHSGGRRARALHKNKRRYIWKDFLYFFLKEVVRNFSNLGGWQSSARYWPRHRDLSVEKQGAMIFIPFLRAVDRWRRSEWYVTWWWCRRNGPALGLAPCACALFIITTFVKLALVAWYGRVASKPVGDRVVSPSLQQEHTAARFSLFWLRPIVIDQA